MHPRQLTQTIPCISRTVLGQQGQSLLLCGDGTRAVLSHDEAGVGNTRDMGKKDKLPFITTPND